MPAGNLTLLDLAARTGSDALIGLIDEVVTTAPEFGTVLAVPRPGTTYKLLLRNRLPPVQFRNVNSGVTPGKSTYSQVIKEMYFLDAHIQIDEAIIQADDTDIGSTMADEGAATLESTMIYLGNQFYYGVNDVNNHGFVGLQSQTSQEITAGGTANTCSAYLVDISKRGVHFSVGNKGRIDMPEFVRQRVKSADGVGEQFAMISNICGYLGLNVGSQFSVYRIRGIDSTHRLTDALAAQLMALVPLARRANLRWFMNPAAALGLQISRSSVGAQLADSRGAGAFAPSPTELADKPITLTDSLLNTETAA